MTPEQIAKQPKYVRDYIHTLEIESGGVRLAIGGMWNEDGLQLSWRPAGPVYPLGDVLFIPTAYQQAKLVALEKGRT